MLRQSAFAFITILAACSIYVNVWFMASLWWTVHLLTLWLVVQEVTIFVNCWIYQHWTFLEISPDVKSGGLNACVFMSSCCSIYCFSTLSRVVYSLKVRQLCELWTFMVCLISIFLLKIYKITPKKLKIDSLNFIIK